MFVYFPLPLQNFLTWDDNINIYQNPHYNPPSLQSTLWFWTHVYNNTYRPLVHTVWAVLAASGTYLVPQPIPGTGESTALNAGVFKAANLFFHALNTLFVWALLKRLTKTQVGAFLGALLWALHPAQVEPVAWITGLNETFCATLAFGALWFYFASLEATEKSGKARAFAIATGLFLLALLTKPSAVALPLFAGIFSVGALNRKPQQDIKPLGFWLVLAVAWAILTRTVHTPQDLGMMPSVPQRFWLVGDAWAFYLQKILWPWPLAIDYGRPINAVLSAPATPFRALFVLALLVVVWKFRAKISALWVAVFALVTWTLPVAGLSPYRFQLLYSLVADRYLYLALFGAAFAIAWFYDRSKKKRVFASLALIVALIYGSLSALQVRTWQNNFTFFAHTLRVTPHSFMAAANLGVALKASGRNSEAIAAFRRAHALKPNQKEVTRLLAQMLLEEGNYREAIPLWRQISAQNPDDVAAWASLGGALVGDNQFQKAIPILQKALRLSPQDVGTHANLGLALWQSGQKNAARAAWQKALRLDPQNGLARQGMALSENPSTTS